MDNYLLLDVRNMHFLAAKTMLVRAVAVPDKGNQAMTCKFLFIFQD